MLYPKTNKKRLALSLDGLWNFSFVSDDYLPKEPLNASYIIGVPGSFNDMMTTLEKRDYVGKVCYEKKVDVPSLPGTWHIRIGAAPHRAELYVNGKLIKTHQGGYLPVDAFMPHDTSSYRISIMLDTRLDFQTFPMGEVIKKEHREIQNIFFDFYNYIGLHRHVWLYHVPLHPIEEITILTDLINHQGVIGYQIDTTSQELRVDILDPDGKLVISSTQKKDSLVIDHPKLWGIGQGYLYTLHVETPTDCYDETFGIRKIEIKNQQLLLNHQPITLKGFGMHEDHPIVGKASLSALNVKDFELLTWIGANSFRTSHYPYDEEMYDLADRYGILVINEMPAVGLNFWSPRHVFREDTVNDLSLKNYLEQFDELIARDKNHPSIIMYSLANEANTHEEGAVPFFKTIFDHARKKTHVPLMIVEYVGAKENKVAGFADVIGINRYMAWYSDFGDLSVVKEQLTQSILDYQKIFNKPIMLTEFGADTIAGMHTLPALAFSEEYQDEFIQTYLEVARKMDGVIGTHMWNFADFQTKQGLTRVLGNRKGVFTRDRQPKMVAHTIKKLWSKP